MHDDCDDAVDALFAQSTHDCSKRGSAARNIVNHHSAIGAQRLVKIDSDAAVTEAMLTGNDDLRTDTAGNGIDQRT